MITGSKNPYFKTIHLNTKRIKREKCRYVLYLQALIPKALKINRNGRSSDLLTFEAFPIISRISGVSVTLGFKGYKRVYSSGNCTGFTPVSLLSHPSGLMDNGTITFCKGSIFSF
jgi:hypothetical protein